VSEIDILDRLRRLDVCALSDALDALGLRHWEIGAVEAARGSERVRIG